MAGLVIAFARGDVPHSSIVVFVGILPLAGAAYGLARRRDACFLAFALVALVLFWFSQGGWFATLLYYTFPFMSIHRHPSHVLNVAKIFVLVLGGLGIDQLLHDLQSRRPTEEKELPRWGRWLLLILAAACAVDVVVNLRSDDLKQFQVDPQYADHSFLLNPNAHYLLMGRFIIYTALFGILLMLARNRAAKSPRPQALKPSMVGGLLLLVYLIDVGFFYALVVKQAPFCPDTVEVGEELYVQRLTFEPRRRGLAPKLRPQVTKPSDFIDTSDLSDHARKTLHILGTRPEAASPRRRPFMPIGSAR